MPRSEPMQASIQDRLLLREYSTGTNPRSREVFLEGLLNIGSYSYSQCGIDNMVYINFVDC